MQTLRVVLFISSLVVIYAGGKSSDSDSILEALGLKPSDILAEARDISSWMVDIRRTLHAKPELMYDLNETAALVRATLDSLGVPYKYPVAKSGIVATIGTGSAPVFALRADMDALPILEIPSPDTADYVSKQPGKMHACGHDAHTAMLLGAARILKARESSLRGTVRLLFQPAEEGGAGGFRMLEEGVMDSVGGVFGLHVWPAFPTGHVGSRPGRLFAAAGFFEVQIRGKGGHAAIGIGHGVVDPVVAAAAVVTALQSIVARDLPPSSEAVVSVSTVHGGAAFNVIPDFVTLGGTLRAFSREEYGVLERRVREVVTHTALAHGCTGEVRSTSFDAECLAGDNVPSHFPSGCTYPPLVNDDALWREARLAAESLVGEPAVIDQDPTMPTMGGEDFAYLAERVPGVFALLGTGNHALNSTSGLHTPTFKLDEAAMPVGAAMHAVMALRGLLRLGGGAAAAAGKAEL